MDITTTMENHSGIDGNFASHKSSAICWRYQKAKGIIKRGQHPLKGAVLFIYKIYLTCFGSGSPKMSAVLS